MLFTVDQLSLCCLFPCTDLFFLIQWVDPEDESEDSIVSVRDIRPLQDDIDVLGLKIGMRVKANFKGKQYYADIVDSGIGLLLHTCMRTH